MMQRERLAAAMLMLCASACVSDKIATTVTAPAVNPNGLAPHTVLDNTPSPPTLTIFPSLIETGAFGPAPQVYISVPTISNVDRTYQLTTNNPGAFSRPVGTIVVPAGENAGNTGIVPNVVSSPTTVTISGVIEGSVLSANLTAFPQGAILPPPIIDTIFATPLTVTGGSPSTATIRLSKPAPTGGLVVNLWTRLPLTAIMPPTVTFPAGATVETVPITTFPGFPNSTTTVLIEAGALNTLVSNGINVVTGNVQLPLGIGSTTLNAPLVGGIATVVGGTLVQARVSLSGPAPTGGALVTLVSTDATVATVPASVVIPAGSTSAPFTVTTKTVATLSSSNVGGSYAGGVVVTTLRVTPPTSPAPTPVPSVLPSPSLLSPAADVRFARGASVTFDWSDVSGAASYTIQISTSNKFTSTTVNKTVTSSQYSAAGLPTSTLWWRVRANAANGAVSNFSSSRRFELK